MRELVDEFGDRVAGEFLLGTPGLLRERAERFREFAWQPKIHRHRRTVPLSVPPSISGLGMARLGCGSSFRRTRKHPPVTETP